MTQRSMKEDKTEKKGKDSLNSYGRQDCSEEETVSVRVPNHGFDKRQGTVDRSVR